MSISSNVDRTPNAHRTLRIRYVATALVLSLAVVACSSGEIIEAGSGDAGPSYTPLTPRSDLISLERSDVSDLVVDPTDETRLLLHFIGAAEPCSGAAVNVTETSEEVTVDFMIGLDPNVAAMTCIAATFDYEVAIQLEAPLGGRTINLAG